MRGGKVNGARVSPHFRKSAHLSTKILPSRVCSRFAFIADRIGWKKTGDGFSKLIVLSSVRTRSKNAKVVSCVGHHDESSGKPRGASTNQSSLDRSSVHLFSLCLCVYSFLLQNSNLWYWYVCTIYPRTIESNPGFLQNCNFLRFHAISREAISIGELHANGRNVRIKMRRVILFRECLLLSSSSFFYIR